jgi:hypothetical protein
MIYADMSDSADMRDGTPSVSRYLMIATLIVWALAFVAKAFLGPVALIGLIALAGFAVLVFLAAGFVGRLILGRFPAIEALIVLVLSIGGVAVLGWWFVRNSLDTGCFSCGAGSSVSNAPDP